MKISVITPSYNSGKYIERAIQSVLHQDFDDWEHIIIDGSSTDGTLDILKKYDHLKWISEPDNGQSDAMNKGFKMATGDIIGYLNADDYYEKNVFKEVINFFLKNKNTDILTGDLRIVKSNEILYRSPSTRYINILAHWKNLFPANPVSYLYRRHVQEQIGLFPVESNNVMDYWFLLRAYKLFRVKKLSIIFGTFDFHENCKTFNSSPQKLLRNELLKYVNKESIILKLIVKFLFIKKYGLRPLIKKLLIKF